jgi:hypothetical protein
MVDGWGIITREAGEGRHGPTQTHKDKATYRSALRTASARRFSCSFLSLETLRSKSIGVVVMCFVRRPVWGLFEREGGVGDDAGSRSKAGSRIDRRPGTIRCRVPSCCARGGPVRVWMCCVWSEQEAGSGRHRRASLEQSLGHFCTTITNASNPFTRLHLPHHRLDRVLRLSWDCCCCKPLRSTPIPFPSLPVITPHTHTQRRHFSTMGLLSILKVRRVGGVIPLGCS